MEDILDFLPQTLHVQGVLNVVLSFPCRVMVIIASAYSKNSVGHLSNMLC